MLLHLIRDSCDCGNTLIIAAAELAAVQYTGQTVSGECLEIADSGCSQLLLFAVLQDCLCQRVFALLFQRQRQGEQFLFRDIFCRQNVGRFRFAAGDRAGLIQSDDLHLACLFQRNGCLEQDAVFCAYAVAHHDRYRCSQTQCAGAADDQNRDATSQGVANGLSNQKPYCDGDNGDGDNCWNKNAGYLVCDFCDRRFGCGGIADHADDLGKGRVLTDTSRLTPEESRLVDGRRRNAVACRLVHRDALAGER